MRAIFYFFMVTNFYHLKPSLNEKPIFPFCINFKFHHLSNILTTIIIIIITIIFVIIIIMMMIIIIIKAFFRPFLLYNSSIREVRNFQYLFITLFLFFILPDSKKKNPSISLFKTREMDFFVRFQNTVDSSNIIDVWAH